MNGMDKLKLLCLIAAGLLVGQPAAAQYFGSTPSGGAPAAQKEKAQSAAQPHAAEDENRYSVVDTSEGHVAENKVEKQPVSSPFDYAYGKKQPAKTAPAKQPYRRYSTVGGVTVETTEEHEEDELIMLYMKDFSIYRSPSGQTRCSAKFSVLTTLPVKLSNISYRLKWPKMETVLTFSDVEPGVENHFDYGLLGDGYYNMDRQPNIIVNRCRAKGMTQRQCASKIRWIKEM